MYDKINQMEPLYPAKVSDLEDLALAVVTASAKLEGRLAPIVLADLKKLLRVVNSYYSNLIEGHSTHPIDIERAMRQDYSSDQDKHDLQIESQIHIKVQEKLAELHTDTNVAAPDFLCWLRFEFYDLLPERLRWVKGENDQQAWVEAGKLRQQFVQVGRHVAPTPSALEAFLHRFGQFYDPATMHGLRGVIALAAAHHRLMWIHPFLDGNGRVARLFTDAYFQRINFAGYGLWNVSRGLARSREAYRQYLAAADAPRKSDLDGRGNLSEETLTAFCRFFLEICLDQANYMNGLLALHGLLERLENYVVLRNAKMIVDAQGKIAEPLHPAVAVVLKNLAIKGETPRGEIIQMLGMGERTGRNILGGLLREGLVLTKSEKGAVRLGFPAHVAAYWLPDLYPQEIHQK